MKFNRRPAHQITPDYEDAGLFKSELCENRFDLLPVVRRNGRADLIVTALMAGQHLVPVIFAGRRKRHASTVVTRLDGLRTAFPTAGSADVFARKGAVLPVEVQGAWRRLVTEDADGLLQRSYQFIAACWTLTLGDGRRMRFGLPPAIPVRVLE